MEIFNLIAGVCSIFSLLLAAFATSQVTKIKKQINNSSIETDNTNIMRDNNIVIKDGSNNYVKR